MKYVSCFGSEVPGDVVMEFLHWEPKCMVRSLYWKLIISLIEDGSLSGRMFKILNMWFQGDWGDPMLG